MPFLSVHRGGLSIWSSGEDGPQSKSSSPTQQQQLMMITQHSKLKCVCVCECVHPCERGRANGRLRVLALGARRVSPDDECGFTMYAIPSVPIKGRCVYNWTLYLRNDHISATDCGLCHCITPSPPPSPPAVRKSYSWFITRATTGSASVSACCLHMYTSTSHGMIPKSSACHCLTGQCVLPAHRLPLWTDTTRGNQRKTSWTQGCWMLSKTGEFGVG